MNQVVIDQDIPTSFTSSPDRPFEPIGVRDQYLQLYDRPNERLDQEQLEELAKKPDFAEDTSRIDAMTKEANEQEMTKYQERKIYNLSMKQVGMRVSDSWHDMVDEMLAFDRSDGFRGFIDIFIKEDRLIYLGITLMFFTIIALLIRSMSGGGNASPFAGKHVLANIKLCDAF